MLAAKPKLLILSFNPLYPVVMASQVRILNILRAAVRRFHVVFSYAPGQPIRPSSPGMCTVGRQTVA